MAQKYERAVQEDLNVGTGATWLGAPGGGEIRSIQVGLHSVARGQRAYAASWTPGAILTTGKVSTTVSVPDAAAGDFVMASHDQMLTSDLRILGHVSAAGVVTVVMHNPTGATVTVGAGTVSVIVFPFLTSAAPVVDPPVAAFEWSGPITGNPIWDVQFTDTSTGSITSWSWDFGDTIGTSTEQNPIYTYATAGPWMVTLTVTGPGGSDADTQQVDMNI